MKGKFLRQYLTACKLISLAVLVMFAILSPIVVYKFSSAAITYRPGDDPWYTSVTTISGSSPTCMYDQYRYCIRNCTSYTAQKLAAFGVKPEDFINLGNGGRWYANAKSRGIAVGETPKIGAAAVIEGSVGHVAFVDAINPDGSINVSSYNGYTEKPQMEYSTRRYTKFVYFQGNIHKDYTKDGKADLVMILTGETSPTGSGMLEAHVMNSATNYSSWVANLATKSNYGNQTTEYLMGDVNGDKVNDLVLIATGNGSATGSGKLEVHALNGATNYSTWLGNWVSASAYGNNSTKYLMDDINNDGRDDLVLIATGNGSATGSGKLEVHVLNAASGFSSWLTNLPTAAAYGNNSTKYLIGDVNGDGKSDITLVATGQYSATGSGKVEVHTLNGATNFSSWLGNWVTPASYTNETTRFVMGDVDGNGKDDVILVATGPTGSGKTEVHALNASNGFSTWLTNLVSVTGYTDANVEFVVSNPR